MPLRDIYDKDRKKTGRKFSEKTDKLRDSEEYSLNVCVWVLYKQEVFLLKKDDEYSPLIEEVFEHENSIKAAQSVVFNTLFIQVPNDKFTIFCIKKYNNDFYDNWTVKDIDYDNIKVQDDNIVKVNFEEFIKLSEQGLITVNLDSSQIHQIFGIKEKALKKAQIIKKNLY